MRPWPYAAKVARAGEIGGRVKTAISEEVRQADTTFFGHPRGLGWLSFTEVWERFSYYGMQALLVLYLTHRLLLPGHVEHVAGFGLFRAALESVYGPMTPQALGSVIFGIYAGLVWMTPILGGLLADRVTGRTVAILAGGSLMTIGHFLMAFEQSFLLALACLLVGVGCFKGNLASQVSSLYRPGDPRAASAFQIYYFGIQVAVIVTPLVCGTLGEVYGWHWGFGAAGVGMVIGMAIYLRGRRWLPPEAPVSTAAAGPRVPLTSGDLRRVAVLVALLPLLALLQVGSFQVANAYVIWGEATLQLTVLGMRIPVTWLQSLDALGAGGGIVLSLTFWRWWAARRPEPDEITKISFGGLMVALSPLILVGASLASTGGHKASLLWAVLFEAVLNIGWANLGPVALGLYARVAPKAANSTIIGVFYLHIFLANMMVGWLGGLLEKMSAANFWLLHVAIAGSAAVILIVVRGPLSRLFAPRPPV
jgi:POT family proton-dependent oligopeptide transporter